MRNRYPNLELIDYIFMQVIKERYPDVISNKHYMETRVEVFEQTWPNTATGFDQPGYASGQAFTSEYTTVIELNWTKDNMTNTLFGVFFGNRFAYIVDDPNETFYKDLEKRNMSGVHKAKEKYSE